MIAYSGTCSCGAPVRTSLPMNPATTNAGPYVWVECDECGRITDADRKPVDGQEVSA